MVNLCRDEVTLTLKHRIEETFGSAFSTNGLGGALTCGVTGMGAGFSHSPLCSSNKERYVFFSFPHIRWARGSWLGGDLHPALFPCCLLISPRLPSCLPAASTLRARWAPCPAPAAPASPAPAVP